MQLKDNIYLKDGRTAVIVSDGPYLGELGLHKKCVMEAPVYLGRSMLDVGKIGAFTQINMGGGYSAGV